MGDKGNKYIEKLFLSIIKKDGLPIATSHPFFVCVSMTIRGEPVWLCSLLRIRVC